MEPSQTREKGQATTVERAQVLIGGGEEERAPFIEIDGGEGEGGAESVEGTED